MSGVLNSRWKVYTDPVYPPGWFYVDEKVAWSGGKKRRRCVGVVESIRYHKTGTGVKFYIVAVLNRVHGQQRAVRLYAHELTRATIIDEIAALGRTCDGGNGAEVQVR